MPAYWKLKIFTEMPKILKFSNDKQTPEPLYGCIIWLPTSGVRKDALSHASHFQLPGANVYCTELWMHPRAHQIWLSSFIFPVVGNRCRHLLAQKEQCLSPRCNNGAISRQNNQERKCIHLMRIFALVPLWLASVGCDMRQFAFV